MPTYADIRKERIMALLEWARDIKSEVTIPIIFNEAFSRHPTVTPLTLRDYASVVYLILSKEKKLDDTEK